MINSKDNTKLAIKWIVNTFEGIEGILKNGSSKSFYLKVVKKGTCLLYSRIFIFLKKRYKLSMPRT